MKVFVKHRSLFFVLLTLIFVSCSQEEEVAVKKESTVQAQTLPEKPITDTTSFKNDLTAFGAGSGVVGVFDVPEMLVLSIMDSSDLKHVSDKVVKNYAFLEEDMKACGAEMNGPVGQITYNNNPDNFVFENVMCIRRIPGKQPQNSKIVVLEASRMLVFNFYGSYQNLFAAYDKIKRYCDKNDLIQSGPMREFYITDPAKEKDSGKWLTQLLVPVVSMRKKPGA